MWNSKAVLTSGKSVGSMVEAVSWNVTCQALPDAVPPIQRNIPPAAVAGLKVMFCQSCSPSMHETPT